MKPFVNFVGVAVPLDAANLDTDQIVPSRFLMKPRNYDYGSLLFHDLREGVHRDPDFVLNQSRFKGAEIIIANANFGCGSAREQAVYALQAYGFRAIFGTSFGDIFRRNCLKNGLLIGLISEDDRARLSAAVHAQLGCTLSIDLEGQCIRGVDGLLVRFDVGQTEKIQLLSGEDDIERTLAYRGKIAEFESSNESHPWLDRNIDPTST